MEFIKVISYQNLYFSFFLFFTQALTTLPRLALKSWAQVILLLQPLWHWPLYRPGCCGAASGLRSATQWFSFPWPPFPSGYRQHSLPMVNHHLPMGQDAYNGKHPLQDHSHLLSQAVPVRLLVTLSLGLDTQQLTHPCHGRSFSTSNCNPSVEDHFCSSGVGSQAKFF